jgi:hypothetical protein
MRGQAVASEFYSRVADAADGGGGGRGTAADADAESDSDADDEKDDATERGGIGAKRQLRMREVKGCPGDISYIAYHTKQFAASAAGVARVHAYRYHHLDGCVKVYANKAAGGADPPINTVRGPLF